LTQASIPVSGVQDIYFALSGTYFTDIYYGEAPVLETVLTLSGGTDIFTSIQVLPGATFSGGSILIGSAAPSGVLQTFDLSTRSVIDVHQSPELEEDNIEDFS
jgi:hypothetical protein